MNFQHDSDSQTRIAQGSLFHQITQRIQRSLELQDILTATVAEMRAFLGIDRVLIYKFRADGSGQVIAEAMQEERLQSLFGLSFPAGDIPYEVRRLFVETRMRSIADLGTQQIGHSSQSSATVDMLAFTDLSYRPLDPCHAEYLKALGVTSSVVVPIVHQAKLWGLLIAHHATRYPLTTLELQDVQGVADQLAVAIAQSSLIDQAREKAHRETTINQVTTLLHALSTIEMQAALDETVDALNGVGGRLYIRTAGSTLQTKLAEKLAEHSVNSVGSVKLYVSGLQPIVPPQAPTTLFEEYPIWQTYFKSSQRNSWAIADLYREGRLRTLQPAFQPTNLRGLLLLPLWYRQQLLGFLSIFRAAIDTEILWAGQVEEDRRHAPAQISFEVWKETRQQQACPWTKSEVALAEALARHFATAVQQHESHQHLQLLNASLEKQVTERTVKLQQQTEQLTQTLNDLQQAQTHLVQT
jgi:light-regulated signal transduction histidine kinase (bacteriophytochrome)